MDLPWTYFDTSTYVKLYVKENGSEEAINLAKKNRILSSAILPSECFSALSRKKYGGEIDEKIFNKLVNQIKEDLPYLEIMKLTENVLTKTEEVVLNSNARALDAIHIASSLIFQELSNMRITFVTSDKKQQDVARYYELETLFVG